VIKPKPGATETALPANDGRARLNVFKAEI
jgi:hypothetical protein